MGTAVRTVYIELRASAERLQQDLVDITGKMDKVGRSGKDAGGQIATGMSTASESFGKVTKTAAEAAVALEAVTKAAARYSAAAAASGTTTEGLVNTYRALRIALDPSMFTVATVATGILAEQTIKLTVARAKLIEQQSLLAARSGLSFGSVAQFDAIAGISGGNAGKLQSLQSALTSRLGTNPGAVSFGLDTLGVSGSLTDPDLLQKIAAGFASIEDPAKRAAAAVQIFGADNAGAALQELNTGFVTASSAVERYGLVLNETSRNQIYTFRKDLVDLKNALLDFSEEKAWVEKTKTRAEEIAAAFEDMAKRGIKAIAQLIDKQTGLGGIGKPGSLSAGDIANANSRKTSAGLGSVADDLFAQAQLAHFRQGQTLEGQQAAQEAAQARADAAYSALTADAQARAQNPHDPSLLTNEQRFGLANQQQSAQALANAIGVRVKSLQDAAEAEKKAQAAAEKLAEFQAGATDRLNTAFQAATLEGIKDPVARSMYQGRIDVQRDADKTTDEEKSGRAAIATQEFRQALAQLQQQLASGVLSDLAKEESFRLKASGDAFQKKLSTDNDTLTKQARVAEIQSQGWGQPDEAKNSMAKLKAERAYGLEVTHTAQQQIAYMQQIADLDNQAAAIRVTEARDELDVANAAGDVVRAAEAQLKLEKAIADQKNQQYETDTQILIAQQQQTFQAQLRKDLEGAEKAVPPALGNALAQGIFGNGQKGMDIGTQITKAMKDLGMHLLGQIFTQMIEKLMATTVAQFALNMLNNWIIHYASNPLGLFAAGGRPSPGVPYIVGEHGPEVRIDDAPGTILPNSMLRGNNHLLGNRNLAPASGSSYRGGHIFNQTNHIYESQDATETARQITNMAKTMIPGAAQYSS